MCCAPAGSSSGETQLLKFLMDFRALPARGDIWREFAFPAAVADTSQFLV
jgi:hypothetical protein